MSKSESSSKSRMQQNYPDDWRSRRKEVFERDDYTCQNCGADVSDDAPTTAHCHHIVLISCGGTHNKSNLTTLCEVCHNKTHGEMRGPTTGADIPTERRFSGDYLPVVADGGDLEVEKDSHDIKGESSLDVRKEDDQDRQWKFRRNFSLPYRAKWWVFGVPEARRVSPGSPCLWVNIPEEEDADE